MNDRAALLEIIGVRKDFPGVRALNDVSFDLIPGEVHFLIRENGAGKSTLVNILSGAYPPDHGHLVLDEQMIRLTPSSAIALGIHTLYQEPALVADLSVVANIFLGRERELGRYGWLLDERQLRRRAEAPLASLHESLDPSSLIRDLSIADRQMVAIAKALSGHLRFLVLDEPTSPLNPVEIRRLTDLVLRLVKQGIGVVYVSHHLEEVSAFGDRATILRDGSVVATVPAKETQSELIRLMVGRELKEQFPKVTVAPGEIMLRVQSARREGRRRGRRQYPAGRYRPRGSRCTASAPGAFPTDPAHARSCSVGHRGCRVSPVEGAVVKPHVIECRRETVGEQDSMVVPRRHRVARRCDRWSRI